MHVSSLTSRGRFVVEFGGKGNVQRIYRALESAVLELTGNPISAANYFPSVGEYSVLLERHGLQVEQAFLFDRWMRLEDGDHGLANWIRMFRRPVLDMLPAEVQDDVLERAQAMVRDELYQDGAWHADYRRLRIVASRCASSD